MALGKLAKVCALGMFDLAIDNVSAILQYVLRLHEQLAMQEPHEITALPLIHRVFLNTSSTRVRQAHSGDYKQRMGDKTRDRERERKKKKRRGGHRGTDIQSLPTSIGFSGGRLGQCCCASTNPQNTHRQTHTHTHTHTHSHTHTHNTHTHTFRLARCLK